MAPRLRSRSPSTSNMTTKEEWTALVEQEDSENFVITIVEEVLTRTQNVLFDKRIDRQLLPFVTAYCKEQLLFYLNVVCIYAV